MRCEVRVAAASLQVANHEVGTLQPYAEAAELSARAEVPLVLDTTAARLAALRWSIRSAGRS